MPDPSLNQDAVRFSVIIPAYNAEKTIATAIRSCLSQSWPPHEIIVVDDHSSDQTAAIARSCSPAVTVLSLEVNLGPSHARNTGWDHASGNYIAFLDADDTWHKDKLQIIQTLLGTRDRPAFLFHSFSVKPVAPTADEPIPPLRRFPFRRLLWRIPPTAPCHPSAVVLRKDIAFRFETGMRYMEDYDLWLRIAARHTVYRLSLPLTQLGRAVLSAGGQSSNRLAMRLGEFRAYGRLVLRQPLYLPLLPVLILASALKHLIKISAGK